MLRSPGTWNAPPELPPDATPASLQVFVGDVNKALKTLKARKSDGMLQVPTEKSWSGPKTDAVLQELAKMSKLAAQLGPAVQIQKKETKPRSRKAVMQTMTVDSLLKLPHMELACECGEGVRVIVTVEDAHAMLFVLPQSICSSGRSAT